MATYRVRTPVLAFDGLVGHIQFRNGEATVEGHLAFDEAGLPVLDEHTAPVEFRHMATAGYLIEEVVADDLPQSDVDGDGQVDDLPKRSASTEAWREFAVAHGMPEDEAAGLSRDELVAHYTAKENS